MRFHSIIWDAIRRFLEYWGLYCSLVQTTDVDDKVIRRAQETGNALDVSRRYAQEYLETMDALGVKRADVYRG